MPLIDLEEGGGGIQSFTGVISESYFNENEYGTSLMLKSTLDDPENYPTLEEGTFTRFFPCGPKWTPAQDGETVVHPDGDAKKFNTSTRIGQLCSALNAVPGIEEAVPAEFSPYSAKSWKGLHLTWGQVPVMRRRMKKDENDNDTGKWESYEATELLPVAVAGVSTNGQTATPLDISTLGLDTDQIRALSLLDPTLPDAKFLEGVIGIPGLTSNTALMGAVSANMPGLRAALNAGPF